MTSIPTVEGGLYLATRLDAYSRRSVGWARTQQLRTELALEALTMARQRRRPLLGQPVQPSDHGGPYTARAEQAVLDAHGGRCAMSRAGDRYDKTLAERCFGTLKAERVHGQRWPSRRVPRRAIFAWIEVFYNRQRRHSALGYSSPAGFEAGRTEPLVA